MHYGDNGILKGAETAVDKYENKAEQEQNELAKIDDYIQNGRATENNINEYSTTEQVVGKWIDGKKVYRKIIPISSGISSRGTISSVGDYSWVEHFLRADAIGEDTSNAISTVYCRTEGNTGLYLQCVVDFPNARYLIVEYTKKNVN